MGVRETSIEVYNRIKDEGLLSQRRLEVYEQLFTFGPCSANELFKATQGVCYVSQAAIQPRLNELVALGVAKEVETRECKITSNRVLIYDVTDRLPVKFEKVGRRKCPHCKGTGVHADEQGLLAFE